MRNSIFPDPPVIGEVVSPAIFRPNFSASAFIFSKAFVRRLFSVTMPFLFKDFESSSNWGLIRAIISASGEDSLIA
ncbi:MAG: hypothetical protein NTV72_00395 [Candidatus Taylorbacteria bacterium]|nr:hypothetical protein [Candidatus Taylorbacteria bacterium]